MKLNIKDIRAHYEDAYFNMDGVMKKNGEKPEITSIKGHMEVITNISNEDLNKLKETVQKSCPVHAMLHRAGIDI